MDVLLVFELAILSSFMDFNFLQRQYPVLEVVNIVDEFSIQDFRIEVICLVDLLLYCKFIEVLMH